MFIEQGFNLVDIFLFVNFELVLLVYVDYHLVEHVHKLLLIHRLTEVEDLKLSIVSKVLGFNNFRVIA